MFTLEKSVYLVGFMATGKSTVGRELATRLQMPFVDMDQILETDSGLSIRQIFAQQGEQAFRELEQKALDTLLAGPPSVIATGGGTPCNGSAMRSMLDDGFVVQLTASLDQVLARAGASGERPLLDMPREQLQDLYDVRAPVYGRAHGLVEVGERCLDEVVAEVEDFLAVANRLPGSLLPRSVWVSLRERSYPVVVENGGLEKVGILARRYLPSKCQSVGIVTDSNVASHYGARVQASLEHQGFAVSTVTIPAGESSKCIEEFSRVSEEFVVRGLDRSSGIIALGGGVVGDLAGFVAATLFRGIPYIQVPTSLLAMVDSAIGGKTGIDLQAGKNLVGAFWQPRSVLVDPEVLITLPARERRAACGELVKYGLLDGEDLYRLVDNSASAMAADDWDQVPAGISEVITRCAQLKANVVSRDERERVGLRAKLNLGHTVGHAIEVAAGYGSLLHGEAVALGLLAACRVSRSLGLCDASLEQRVKSTLHKAQLATNIETWCRTDVLKRMKVDKKRTGENIRFITISAPGDTDIHPLTLGELERILPN